ncbi:tRNA (adenosine(37)-N6)-threonylcarbamoyltransferase complex ATPase subunit type 1 TsaE [Candidatus Dependentiae bacterium]|nr:MAG: tRNA (adenosine(37)-N6)-threonylcarbamoyltransferase complex ATPase subunit type 1 TsaE [Candidatus Dependentiae bacterium]
MSATFTLHYTYDELGSIIQQYESLLKQKQIITFTGGLGAGKTTFIRHLLTHWGVEEASITSPTFTYVNVYTNKDGITFYHFDLYRIQTLQEFTIAGFAEYLYAPSSVALIEWPEPIMPLIKSSFAHCTFAYGNEEDQRIITITT